MTLSRADFARALSGLVKGTKVSTDRLTDRLMVQGRELGWIEVRNGDVVLTATGRDALREDWRTDAERAADQAATERLAAGFNRELRGLLDLLKGTR